MNIHYKTKRHFELGFRAAYPILVVQILLVWFNWSGDSLTYISGVFPVLSVTTYLGSQLEISRSYLWGAIIGSIFGTIASYSAYVNTTFQILLLFLGLIVLNRISFGDRATKVIVSLFYFLGTLLPNISDNGYPPGDAIASLILLMFVPCAVSIVTMLIPFPKLASDAAISNVRLICTDMDEAIILLLRSFEDDLYADVHRAKCATTLQRLEERLEFLRLLTQYSATEAMFLPYNQLPEALSLFIGVNTQLLNDMYGLRSVLKEIIPNYTQNLYCVEMQRPFILYAIHIRAISRLVQTRFSQLGVWHQLGLWQHTVADDHLYGLGDPVLTKSSQRMKTDDNLLQHSNKEFQEDLADNFESKLLEKTTTKLGVLLRRLAQRDLSIDDQLKSFDAIMTSFSDARNTFLGTFQVIRLKYIWKDAAVLFSQKMGLQALEDIAYMTPELAVEIAAPVTDADAAAVDNVRQDNKKFGHMNYTPRNAVFCRLMLIRTLLESYRGLFIRKPVLPFAACRSGWNFLIACLNNNFESCVQILEAIAIFCRIIRNVFYNLISLAPPLIQDEEAIVNWNELRSYLQPAKIAGVIAILSYFVIFPVDGVISSQDALWSCFAVIVTRQDYVSSTFFTSVQRLEGTLVGAFFAVIVITALGCANSGETNCDPGYKVPILTVWAGLCCMFKEGVQHGYSATVAAFTPIILITNPTGTSGERAGVRYRYYILLL